MVNEIASALIGVMGSLLIAIIVGVIGYLLKDKVESIESDIDEIKKEVKQESVDRKNEHDVVIKWLSCITEALQEDGIDVDKPDEVDEVIDTDDD